FPQGVYLTSDLITSNSRMRLSGFLLVSLLTCWSLGCKQTKTVADAQPAPTPTSSSPALLSFDQGAVTQEEFERVYAKNNGGPEAAAAHTPEQLREYLDLYVNFKRKVFEAEAMGLHETPAFKQEFAGYKKQLAQPYLSAREVEDKLIDEAYDRSQYKVKASHILLSVGENAQPADTMKVYQQILAYRDSVINGGKDFGEMAAKYSQDPSAKGPEGSPGAKGNLGYFSVFDMVYPFESAAFKTSVGDISQPIRTRFGYHLVKVDDKVKSEGKKRVSHILIRVGDRYSAKTDEQAEAKVKELFQKLGDGADFGELAAQYSDDPGSARRGGDLGNGPLIPDMENIKLTLNEGEVAEPFQTRFGWHIMKVTEVERLQSLEDAKATLKQRISRDSRSKLGKTVLLQRIKDEYGYTMNQENLEAFSATLGQEFARGSWKPDTSQAAMYNKPLFSLTKVTGNERSIQDMIDFYQRTRARRPRMAPADAARDIAKAFTEQELLEFEESRLPEKYPDFRYLLQEYRDGILLFTLMEQKVWKKAVEDTTGLREYYDTHQDEFKANATVDVREYRTADQKVAQAVDSLLKAGMNDSYIDSVINDESSLTLRIISQTFEKGKDEVDETLFSAPVGQQSAIEEKAGFYHIQVVEAQRPAGIKPFDKARSAAITQYQDYLEKTWLAELAEKYPVSIDETVFNDLF
ncbi:MAG: peptidylprolyl isomerase, partial [Bacteroidota bacterium]